MNPRKRKNVEKGLERKGFQKNHTDYRKFIYHKDTGEKTAVWTKTSHGSSHKDISPNNLRVFNTTVKNGEIGHTVKILKLQ